jgi:hypothetical protein
MNPRLLINSLVCAVVFLASVWAHGQSAPVVQQGTAFATQLAPSSPAQVVNPAGVNAAAWSSTSVPSVVPSNLGAFSAPTTSSQALTAAQSGGLTALANNAMSACANYVPGPVPDPLRVQECAAVNFLTNQCMSPTTTEAGVMTHLGTTQQPTGNCSGTYGQAAQTFGFGNQVTAADPIFAGTNTLNQTAAQTADQSCSTQSVVTAPAQYQTNYCVKNGSTTPQTCSQFLNVSIVTSRTAATQTDTCPTGTLVGDYCQASSSSAAQPNYVCPAGQTLEGTLCVGPNVTTPAIIASYTCPTGQTLAGSTCVDQINTDDGAASTAYSCAPGATLSGTQCTSTATGSATYPPGEFCQDGYGDIPAVWSISGNVCTMQWYAGEEPPETKAVDMTTGCPGLPDFVPLVAGIQINTTSSYRNGDCQFVTHTGGSTANSYCPLPNPQEYVLQNQTTAAPVAGYMYTSTTVCSYVPVTHYSCPAGETLDSNNQCQGGTTTTAIVTSFFCPTGGAYVNGQCVTTAEANATVTYSCPTDDTVVGTRCDKTTTVTTPATPDYSCPAGYTLSGSTCSEPGSTIAATVTYSCPAGATLSGNTCVTTTTVPATIEYSCIDGSAPIAGFCVIKSAQTSWTDTCSAYEASAGAPLPAP